MRWYHVTFIFGLALVAWLACGSAATRSAEPGTATGLQKLYEFDEYGKQLISFYYCQAGFPVDGYKPVYVWTREEFSTGTAFLRNCTRETPCPCRSSPRASTSGGGRTG